MQPLEKGPKIKAFIFDEGTANEFKLMCNEDGFPDIQRKKKRSIVDIKNFLQKAEPTKPPTVLTTPSDLEEELLIFDPKNAEFIEDNIF